jgi:hypothetical protein
MTIQQLIEIIFYAWLIWNTVAFVRAVFIVKDNLAQYKMLKPMTDGKQEIDCKVEHHGNQMYLWTLETETFLAQGKDLAEIKEKLKASMPDIILVIKETDKDLEPV